MASGPAEFRRLTRAERRVVIDALALTIVAVPAARLLPVRRAVSLAASALPRRRGASAVDPARVAVLADAAAGVVTRWCLARALVVQGVLAARGEAAHVVLGVARAGQALRAHAWVEQRGVALVPPGSDACTPMLRLAS